MIRQNGPIGAMLQLTMSQDDLNDLLGGAVEVAKEYLADATEFAPFALAMQIEDGEMIHLEPEEDASLEDAEQVRAVLVAGLREGVRQGRFKATAIVSDVTLEDDKGEAVVSAIHVALEHADADPVTCIVPYEIAAENVELAELMAEPGERVVFEELVEN